MSPINGRIKTEAARSVRWFSEKTVEDKICGKPTRDLDTCAADTYHRAHATVELAIRDLKESAGLSRCPSRRFPANGAWLACCVLAHNLARWTARLGRAHPTRQLTVAATIPNRLLTVPGRLVNHSGRHRLEVLLSKCPFSGV